MASPRRAHPRSSCLKPLAPRPQLQGLSRTAGGLFAAQDLKNLEKTVSATHEAPLGDAA